MKRAVPILLGAAIGAVLIKGKNGRTRRSAAPSLPDGTPRAQILFFHAQWCPACQKAKPEMESIARRYPQIAFMHVDIEKDPEMASQFSVSSIPTFIALVDGKEVDRREGFKNGTDLEAFVSDALEVKLIETNEQKALEA